MLTFRKFLYIAVIVLTLLLCSCNKQTVETNSKPAPEVKTTDQVTIPSSDAAAVKDDIGMMYEPDIPVSVVEGMATDKIATKLYEEYLEYYTGQDMIKALKLEGFEIISVECVKKESPGKNVYHVRYSVQVKNEETAWVAGNGEYGSDSWIRNKSEFFRLVKQEDSYKLNHIGTDY